MASSNQSSIGARRPPVPLWRSKRFLASVFIGGVLSGFAFFLTGLVFPAYSVTFAYPPSLPVISAITVFLLTVAFLPRFIVQLRNQFRLILSRLIKSVIEDFLKESAKRASKRRKGGGRRGAKERKRIVVLDTSAIIDGRFLSVVKSGFLRADFLVPQSVLGELQNIADSKDGLRRERGRRGLGILKQLKKVKGIKVSTPDYRKKYAHLPVDRRLLKICQEQKADLLTVDFNLNQVSGISGVKVLNINELVNGIKTTVLPGETLSIKLVQKGKDGGQAVGYLSDGTMVVVEGGEKHLRETTRVVVSRLLQTSAGQMIFARLP